jgi:hypothetical protein
VSLDHLFPVEVAVTLDAAEVPRATLPRSVAPALRDLSPTLGARARCCCFSYAALHLLLVHVPGRLANPYPAGPPQRAHQSNRTDKLGPIRLAHSFDHHTRTGRAGASGANSLDVLAPALSMPPGQVHLTHARPTRLVDCEHLEGGASRGRDAGARLRHRALGRYSRLDHEINFRSFKELPAPCPRIRSDRPLPQLQVVPSPREWFASARPT